MAWGLRGLICGIVLFSILLLDSARACQVENVRVVALTGEPAAGIADAEFSFFGDVVDISATGQVAFTSSISGDSINTDNNSGIWVEDANGDLNLVVQEGTPAIGTAFDFSGFSHVMMNSNGDIAFLAGRSDSMSNDSKRGFWSTVTGSLQMVASSDFQASGLPSGVTFRTIDVNHFAFNDLGQIVFNSSVQGVGVDSTNNTAIFSQGGGSGLRLVARKGSLAPGTPDTFLSFDNTGFTTFNNNGQAAFQARVNGPDVTNLTTYGLWADASDFSLRLVARAGNQAPFFSSGVNYSWFGSPMLNDAGDATYLGAVHGDGITVDDDFAIWAEQNGAKRLVVREGDDAPGTNGHFDEFSWPFLTSTGRCIFRSHLEGVRFGIWAEDDTGQLNLVAVQGEQAAKLGAGVFYDSVRPPVVTPEGKIAFSSTLSGNVDSTNDKAIWAYNGFGILTLVIRKGDVIDVDAGPETDERVIADFVFENPRQSDQNSAFDNGFNPSGQLAFRTIFVDGSQAIVVAEVDNRVETAARSYDVADGTLAGGSLKDLVESDNSDLSIRRNATDVLSRVTVELETISPAETVSTISLVMEGAVFARTSVVQSIDLFDFVTQDWEEIDVRDASRFSDSVATVAPEGDLSRFIETGTRVVRFRLRFQSPRQRQRFTAFIDQVQWIFE